MSENAPVSAQSSISTFYKVLPWIVCGLGAVFYCYEYFLRIAPSVMTAEIRAAFQIDATTFGYVAALYYWAYTPMQMPVGIMMDRYGPRRLFFVACLVCAVGTLMYVNPSHNLMYAKLGRFLVGFGSAFAFVGVLKLATIWLPSNRFAFFSGLVVMLGMTGAMAGDVLLAILFKHFEWQSVLSVSGWAGLILAALIWFIVRDKKPHILVQETQSPNPVKHTSLKELLVDFVQLLNNPQVWINGIVGCLLFFPMSAFAELWGISYLETAYDLTKTQASSANAMVFLGWAIGAPLMGWISDVLKKRRLLLLLGSFFGTLAIFIIVTAETLSKTQLHFLLFAFGLATSTHPLVFVVAREIFSKRLAGSAIALTNMMTMISGVIAQPLIGRLLDAHWSHTGKLVNGIRQYTQADYNYAMMVVPVGLLFSTIMCFFLKETYHLREQRAALRAQGQLV